jgi:hypothetical protein
VHELSRD